MVVPGFTNFTLFQEAVSCELYQPMDALVALVLQLERTVQVGQVGIELQATLAAGLIGSLKAAGSTPGTTLSPLILKATA